MHRGICVGDLRCQESFLESESSSGKYPKVVKRTGESPPQYVDWDEEK